MRPGPFSTPIARLRSVGIAEAASFVLLLGIAMPLKYLADMPMAVTVVGWAHGALFTLYCLTIAECWQKERWPFSRVMLAFIAAWLPLGPVFFDKKILKDEA